MSPVKPPSATTLKKYGLTQAEWLKIAEEQGFVCPICGKLPENGKLVTDHEHRRGYKKMSDKERKIFVRGLPCLRCNLMYLPVGITSTKARNIVKYLEAYEAKVLEELSKSMPKNLLKKEEN